MNLSKAADAVKGAFKPGITPSAPENTHVELASQSSPEPRPDHGEKDGNGSLPGLISVKGDRARVLQDIYARRAPQAEADAAESLPATDEDGNETESTPVNQQTEGADLDAEPQGQTPDAGATTVAAQPAPAAPAPEETRAIIVDGQTVQVPLSKILETGQRALQKDFTADNRLNQATQILEEAKRVAAQPQAPQAPAEPAMSELSDDQLAELIQFGTKEQAASAIKALRSSAQPAFKPEEIVRAAQQAVAPQMAFEAAKNFASTEYGDLLNDPDLRSIFLNRENDARKSGDQRPYAELYKAIGDDLRVKFNRPKPGAALPAAQPSTQGRSMVEKQAAKAQAPAAPRLASQRLDGDGQQPRPPTRAEIIDKQRAARGFQKYAAQK